MTGPLLDLCHLLLAIFAPIALAGWLLGHRPPAPSSSSQNRKNP
ncbi:hypothetical protein ACLSSQ_03055 [Azospira sp. APE16]